MSLRLVLSRPQPLEKRVSESRLGDYQAHVLERIDFLLPFNLGVATRQQAYIPANEACGCILTDFKAFGDASAVLL